MDKMKLFILILLVLSTTVFKCPLGAAVLFNDDFEGTDLSRWDGIINYQWDTGSVNLDSSKAALGSKCVKCDDTSTYVENTRIGLHKNIYFNSPFYFRFYVYAPVTTGAYKLVSINDAIGTLRLTVSGSNLCLAKEPLLNGNWKNSAVTVAENRWYCVELRLPACGSSGATIDWWIDGVKQPSITHDLTESKAWLNIAVGKIEGTGGGTGLGTAYIDEAAVSEEYIGPAAQSATGVIEFKEYKYDVNKDAGSVLVTVSRRYGSSGSVTVSYTTLDKTARAGSDYSAVSGTLSWANGETADRTFTVNILNNSQAERKIRFDLAVSTQSGAAVSGTRKAIAVNIINPSAVPNKFYVSRTGNNSDGLTWAAAWNELDRIVWDNIQPGDIVYIDGGTSEMTYLNTLKIIKCGEEGAPITIKVSGETGRNGKVIMFGGRPLALPDGGQASYDWNGEGIDAIDFYYSKWITVDGTKWRGITIHGGTGFGISNYDEAGNENILIRNMELYDCGLPRYDLDRFGGWGPEDVGAINFGRGGSKNITLERMIIHDGCDAFNGNWIDNFVIRQSWIYIARMLPSDPLKPFSYTGHPDAFQTACGNNWLFEDLVIHGYMQGIYLDSITGSEAQTGIAHPQVDNVTIRNCLAYQCSTANIQAKASNPAPSNWTVENVTAYDDPAYQATCLRLDAGYYHTIRDCITSGWVGFRDGQGIPADWTVTGNTRWNHFYNWTAEVNPMFAAIPVTWSDINADFRATNPAVAGKGSRVTSVAKLFELFPDETGVPASPGAVQFSAAAYNKNENGGSITITVNRGSGNSGTITVRYATGDGTAVAGSDYTSRSGVLTWTNADSGNRTFTVGIVNDTAPESNETINLVLSNVTGGAALGIPAGAVITITDDDTAGAADPGALPSAKLSLKHSNLCPISRGEHVRFLLSGAVGNSELRIFTITGKLVKTLYLSSGEFDWDLINETGSSIKPGIYLYAVSDGSGNKKAGKVVISR